MKASQRIQILAEKVRKENPLVHNITNYVTVNDCANAVLAVGGSPIMADDEKEAADITAISSALVLNIGTLNQRTIPSMILSGKKANELGIPVVFDPVGAGASAFRNETAKKILQEVKISVIRGNLSELSFLAGLGSSTKGVDSSAEDEEKEAAAVAEKASKIYQCTVCITGKMDVVTDGTRIAYGKNGNSMMAKVTGTGCMATAVTGAFCSVTDNCYDAALAAITVMGIAGERAYEEAGNRGTGSFHIELINALSTMSRMQIEERTEIEEF